MTGREISLAIPVLTPSSITSLLSKTTMATHTFTRAEIEEIVIMERLHLYNWGNPCGAQAIRRRLDREGIQPLPSISTIKRILSRNCLTHRRTGYYPEDYI
jgi:hypothetical protein